MSISQQMLACLTAGTMLVAAGCNRTPALTPEAASAKGDALLKEMSKNMAAAQTFGYTSDEQRERVGADGKKTVRHATRHVIVRRPNGVAFTGKGDGGEVSGWYDGQHLTLLSNTQRVWARGPMPPTLDEALDFMSAEYSVPMPTADLLYSDPYDALMTKDTKGGWVDVQKVGNVSCDHVAYQQEVVDWELWLGPERHLPCKFKITYKKEPGQPSTTVVYSDPEKPQVTDATFEARIPDGFQRIKIMRHATVTAPDSGATPNATATTGSADKRSK